MSNFLCYSKVSDILSYLKDGERCGGVGREKAVSNEAASCWKRLLVSLVFIFNQRRQGST